jgi:FecR protein
MKISGYLSRLMALGACLALTSTLVTAAPQPGQAEVTRVRGTASIGNNPAKVGDVAGPGSVIKTGPNSQLDLNLGLNGPDITVSADTTITVDELSFDDAGPETVVTTKLNLQAGKVAGYVKKTSSQSSYTVVTPTTTAAIRGTTYLVTSDGDVYVWDGCVDVQFQDRRFAVCAGQHFDPRIGQVVPNTLPPVIPPRVQPPVIPVGPVINLSPTQGSGGNSGGASEGEGAGNTDSGGAK